MQPQDHDVEAVKESLIGIVDKMSDILKKSPENFEQIAHHLNKFNTLALKVAMGTYVSKADKELLEKAANMLDKEITPFLQENKNLKQSQNKALEHLQQVKNNLQNSTPRMGR
ncbi:MAG: hypothetical protein JO149_02005 [Gammaproteobacteria bacterium]|nr:hypothetical protein [Gammaproteobacteria bacterium]